MQSTAFGYMRIECGVLAELVEDLLLAIRGSAPSWTAPSWSPSGRARCCASWGKSESA
jgi:hypothetical protein